jgi:hypothetical protein
MRSLFGATGAGDTPPDGFAVCSGGVPARKCVATIYGLDARMQVELVGVILRGGETLERILRRRLVVSENII